MKYDKRQLDKINKERSEVMEIVIEASDKVKIVEDLTRIKRIFNTYFQTVRNVFDKERLIKMFQGYSYSFLYQNESDDCFMNLRDQNGNLSIFKIIDDISRNVDVLEVA